MEAGKHVRSGTRDQIPTIARHVFVAQGYAWTPIAGRRGTVRAWAAFAVVFQGAMAALGDTELPASPADRDEILAAAVRALSS